MAAVDWLESDNATNLVRKLVSNTFVAATSGGGGGGAVSSVFGRAGAVVAANNDYTWAQINKAVSSLADLATKNYSDLTGKPTLGTAAAANTGDFATSTQGTKADSAVQPGDLGTAAALDVGVSAGDVVQLGAGAKLPAVDGSLLTGLAGGGDMLKSTYDPQSLNHISGINASGKIGGLLVMDATTMGNGGDIITYAGNGSGSNGGEVRTIGGAGASAIGGPINTSGGGSSSAFGGPIHTNGGTLPGGPINTSDGGGKVDTTGTGEIGLGVSGTRTTFVGTATSNRNISLPDADGTLLLSNGSGAGLSGVASSAQGSKADSAVQPGDLGVQVAPESGWGTPASAGDKSVTLTNYDTAGLAAAAGLVGLGDTNTQVGELTSVLQALITYLRAQGVLTS